MPTGQLDPESIHLPSVYVDRLIKGPSYEKRIEFRLIHTPGEAVVIPGKGDAKIGRERIVRRAAKEIKDGMYVNLGIGILFRSCVDIIGRMYSSWPCLPERFAAHVYQVQRDLFEILRVVGTHIESASSSN